MKGKVFVDTNVLVYLFSHSEPDKKSVCAKLIDQLNQSDRLVWSTQVMQEFYVAMTKKHGQDPLVVKSAFTLFSNFELIVNDHRIISDAIDIQILHQLSFWDSLVVSSARAAKCTKLISEDMHHGLKLANLQIVNPFLLDVSDI